MSSIMNDCQHADFHEKSGVRNTCTCELHDLLRSVKRHRYIDILKGTVFRKLQYLHFQSHMQIP